MIIVALIHHGFRFLDELTLAFILELALLRKLFLIIIFLLSWSVVLDIAITNQLLIALLLLHTRLLLLHLTHLHRLSLFLTLAFGLFLLNALLFLIFAPTVGLLLLLASRFLFSLLALLFSLSGGSLFLRSLGFHLLTHGLFLVILTISCTLIRGASAAAKNLLNVRSRVNASGGSTEHSLEEKVCLFRFMTGHDFGWLHIQLLADDELGELDQLDEEIDLRILFSDSLRIKLITIEKPGSELSCAVCRSENIMEISEGRLSKELLSHLRFLEDLLVHLSGRLPKFVTHISIYSNFNYKS